jgi:hypothetical protein
MPGRRVSQLDVFGFVHQTSNERKALDRCALALRHRRLLEHRPVNRPREWAVRSAALVLVAVILWAQLGGLSERPWVIWGSSALMLGTMTMGLLAQFRRPVGSRDHRVRYVARLRTALFESALRCAGPRPQCAATLKARDEHWDRAPSRRLQARAVQEYLNLDPWLGALFLATMWWSMASFHLQTPGYLWQGELVSGFLFLGLALGIIRLWRGRQRAIAGLTAGRCPDCAYPLAGIPAALIQCPQAGPARCPECGTLWPLVPPAVLSGEHAEVP